MALIIWDTESKAYVSEVLLHTECHMYFTLTQMVPTTRKRTAQLRTASKPTKSGNDQEDAWKMPENTEFPKQLFYKWKWR